eukprot:849367_1
MGLSFISLQLAFTLSFVCEAFPTGSPSAAPSASPSIPSAFPSPVPTQAPSLAPTVAPSVGCTSTCIESISLDECQPGISNVFLGCYNKQENIVDGKAAWRGADDPPIYLIFHSALYDQWIINSTESKYAALTDHGDNNKGGGRFYPPFSNVNWTVINHQNITADTCYIQFSLICYHIRVPTKPPSPQPSFNPTNAPSTSPTMPPSTAPSTVPSHAPSSNPTISPSLTPSNYPTNAPSLAPSNQPSTAPSTTPSNAPTNHPTMSPSLTPTYSPTNAPSTAPSNPPSTAPSTSPSNAPSNNPTLSPSLAPTDYPTGAPSAAPTVPPTVCHDDDIHAHSNDGEDIITNVILRNALALFQRNVYEINDTNTSIIELFHNVGWDQNIRCSTDINICKIECLTEGACPFINVVTDDADITQIMIECSGQYSCVLSSITISNSNIQFMDVICAAFHSCLSLNIIIEQTEIEVFTVQCLGLRSCASLSIELKHANYINQLTLKCIGENDCTNMNYFTNETIIENTTIVCSHLHSCNASSIAIYYTSNDVYQYMSLYCVHSWSCEGVEVYLNAQDHVVKTHARINCYLAYACNHLVFERTKSIDIELALHNFSENVNIKSVDTLNRLNVVCGNANDKHYIRYKTHDIKTEHELIELARREYKASNRLPCEDIHVDCTSDVYFPKSCDWKYQLNDINLQKFMMSMDDTDVSCYWVELSKLLTANCSGTCNTDLDLYNYNQSLKLDIRTTEPKSLNNSNSSTSQILTICNEFFGTINDTLYTLYEIDAIFEFILRVTFTPFQIYDITDGPFSELADGVAQLNCSTFEGITLDTSMNLVSGIDNKQTFDTLFGEEFISEVERLLSLLFDFDVNVIVTIINEEDVVHVIEGFELWHLLCILTGMIIVVILLVYYYNYLRYNKRIEIKNPMIITVAIGIYDPDPPNPEVINGGLSDLYGIDKDVRNLFGLFRDQMHYTFFPNHDLSTIKMQWSKEEIMNLLHEKAIELSQNLNIFHGLVVIMSGHGMDECILTSDYKMIDKKHIHRLFSIHKDVIQCRSIPRLFIFDCYSDRSYIDEEEEKGKGNNDVDYKVLYENNAPWARDEENPDHKLAVVHAENQDFHSQMRTTIGSDLIGQFVEKMKINCERDGVCCSHNKLFLGEIMGEIQDELERQGNQLPECKFNNGTENIIFITNESKDKNPTESAIQLSELKSLNEVDHPLERDLNVNKSVQDLNEMNRMSSDELMNKIGGIIKPSNEAVEIDDTQLQFGEVLCSMGINLNQVKDSESKVPNINETTDVTVSDNEGATCMA